MDGTDQSRRPEARDAPGAAPARLGPPGAAGAPGAPGAPEPAAGDEAPPGGEAETRQSRMQRLRAERARAEAWAGQSYRRLEAARPRSTAIDSVFRAVERDTSLGGNVLSGAVAFRVFMFMVPYVFLIVLTLGTAADSTGSDPRDVARSAGVGGLAAQAVASAAKDLSTWQQIVSIVASAFALLLAARALVKVLRTVHALAWQVPLTRARNTTKAALVLTGVVAALNACSILINGARDRSLVAGIVLLVLALAALVAVWVAISWYLPHAAVPWRELVPGAVVLALGIQVLHVVTVTWIAYQVSSKTETYGAIGLALALLLWAYLLGRVITLAAITNAALWYRAHPEAPRELAYVPVAPDPETRPSTGSR